MSIKHVWWTNIMKSQKKPWKSFVPTIHCKNDRCRLLGMEHGSFYTMTNILSRDCTSWFLLMTLFINLLSLKQTAYSITAKKCSKWFFPTKWIQYGVDIHWDYYDSKAWREHCRYISMSILFHFQYPIILRQNVASWERSLK